MNTQNYKRINRHISLLVMVFLSGCATMPNAVTEQVENRRVEYALVRHDTITVVFENGLGAKMDYWAKAFREISKNTSAFAYNRAGYGRSAPASTPRDGDHIVDELRALLKSKGLNPPYLLVGHSLGGLYMQLFARRYPGEVAALILVDTTHPEQFKGKNSPEKWPAWVRVVFGAITSAVEKQEFDSINATGESVMSLPSFTGKPVIVLSALKPMKETGELADDANEKRRKVVELYPGSKQVWVESGHDIPVEKPEAVISAIREVVSLQTAE